MSTLEHLVLQSEHYYPVAQINLHKGLKCKIKIITSVRLQSTVLFSAIQLAGSLSSQLLCREGGDGGGGETRLGYQEASRILMNSCQGYELWNEHFTLGLFMFLIITPIHLFISIISIYLASMFFFMSCLIIPHLVADSFCINMSCCAYCVLSV